MFDARTVAFAPLVSKGISFPIYVIVAFPCPVFIASVVDDAVR